MSRDINYETTQIAYDDQYPKETGGGIQCKNYKVCGTVLPKWWWESKGCYLCIHCDMMFGKELDFIENIECPICFDYTQGVSQLKCDHMICIECFKRCYDETEPQFPYPELEEEYVSNPDDPKWQHYPFIHLFYEEWNKWDQYRKEKREKTLSCPLCRK